MHQPVFAFEGDQPPAIGHPRNRFDGRTDAASPGADNVANSRKPGTGQVSGGVVFERDLSKVSLIGH